MEAFHVHTGSRSLVLWAYLALFAGDAWAVAGWTSYGTVAELNPTIFGRFLVKLDVSANPSGCRSKEWFYRDYTGTGADHMFRALLAAVTSGQKVRVYVTGVCDLKGYSEVSSASIVP